jgi:hypothetical protein
MPATEVPRSELLPGIDLDELLRFLDRPTTSEAMLDHRRSLQVSR